MVKSQSLRDIVLLHHNNGQKISFIHHSLAATVQLRTIQRWIKSFKEHNITNPSEIRGHRKNTANNSKNQKRVKRLFNQKMPGSISITLSLILNFLKFTVCLKLQLWQNV